MIYWRHHLGVRKVSLRRAEVEAMAYLQVETRDGQWQVQLDRDRLSIGRLAINDIMLPYQQISRRHAELRRIDGVWWIGDLHSTNGLQVRAHRVERHALRPGERVQLAPGIVVYLVVEGAEDAASLATVQMATVGQPLPGMGAPFSAGPPTLPDPHWQPPAPAGQTAVPPGGPPTGESLEGDLFRRNETRRTYGPPAAQPGQVPGAPRAAPAEAVLLHICQTCGQMTAPDVERCQYCHSSIAHTCRVCGLELLPVQDRCPRCRTSNPASVRRRSRMTGA
jgi:pSer/pThr/pTyr-binding forkhead associated (FHA) protein